MSAYSYANRILCFGEALIRLTPPDHERLEQTNRLDFYIEGAEAITSLALAHQGENVAYLTVITDNRLGNRVLSTLRGAGVDTSRSIDKPGRMGVFYFERGMGDRISTLLYDRENTPITLASRSDFDWDSLLNGINSFYFSGVLPALTEQSRLTVEDALIACKGRGIKTFCDLNYRSRMWSQEVARRTMDRLLPYIDVCVGCDQDIWSLFPRAGADPSRTTTLDYVDYYRDIARGITQEYGCSTVAVELRSLGSSGIGKWQGLILHEGEQALTDVREVISQEHSGCGDSFAAGIVHGVHQHWDARDIVNYALTASVLKSTIPGSINYLSSEEIIQASKGSRPLVDY